MHAPRPPILLVGWLLICLSLVSNACAGISATGSTPTGPSIDDHGSSAPTSMASAGPTDGPPPSGTVLAQGSLALKTLGLHVADGVTLSAPLTVRWFPIGFYLRPLSLMNHRSTTIAWPFSMTVLRWDGTSWALLPCSDLQTTGHTGLCDVQDVNVQTLQAGASAPSSGDTIQAGPLGFGQPPGTYALVVPIWSSSETDPTHEPIEGAVAIINVSVTAPPP